MADIEWKTAEEIDKEESKLSELDRLKQDNEMLAMAVMELTTYMMMGGK